MDKKLKFVKVFHILINGDVKIEKAEKIMEEIKKKYPEIEEIEFHASKIVE